MKLLLAFWHRGEFRPGTWLLCALRLSLIRHDVNVSALLTADGAQQLESVCV
jgi:hypothetical protein